LVTLCKVLIYIYFYPQNGFFDKLKARFGSGMQLFLNTEIALTLLLKHLPGRVPGMYVALDERNAKRFRKIVERLGLKVFVFSGQKELVDACEMKHVLAVLVPDSYGAAHGRYKKRYENSPPVKIVYQNRRQPKSVDMAHDVYIWESRTLPRFVSGAVMICDNEELASVRHQIRDINNKKSRVTSKEFIAELWRAYRGYESKFRRIDNRPPKIMARLLYTMINEL